MKEKPQYEHDREQRKEFSILVNNLPCNLDQFGLKGIFQRAGRVSDAYILPRRARKTHTKFGFVRFWSRGDASKICVARYERRRHRLHSHQHREAPESIRFWRKKKQEQGHDDNIQVVRVSWESHSHNHLLKVLVNTEFEEWLNRSLVCTTDETRDLATLSSTIINGFGQCTKVCALGSFKFILTFPVVEKMEETCRNREELDLWSSEIKKWSRYECCDYRKLWLEIFGVPPHGWLWKNFNSVGEIWGRVVCLSKPIYHTNSFENMKILIVTDVLQRIEEDLFLILRDEGFRIFIKEVGPALPLIQTEQSSPCFRPMEDNDSNNEVPGFEDLDVEMAYENGVAQSHLRNNLVNDDLDSDVVKETPALQINSNSNRENEMTPDNIDEDSNFVL
ncbi:hypothetical protein Cgig2_012930 [Carnegiea gigantea]|uniref:RRM domain-containing protein n=1 Tax=Carnegiea gigantea TaxID=171969 RepID=A0A9Q1GKW5_9CARY|nr:hypothetical protein Cgig2_012930 [Carnegiea gigantea]